MQGKTPMLRTLSTAATLAAFVATPLAAFDVASMSEAERTAFRAEVRSYLMENPEVLLEAIRVLEQRQAAEAAAGDTALIAEHADAIFEDGYSWIGGNPEGDVTVVEFLDYRCGYCKRAFPEVKELLARDGNIRLVVKEFPILGDQSVLASRFAIAVKAVEGDEAYSKVHDNLMALRSDVTEAALTQMSDEMGLDTDAILFEMESPITETIIAKNRELAQILKINGTPSFVFEDQMLRGYVPLEGMQDLVAQIRGQ